MLKCGKLEKTVGGKSGGEHKEGEEGHHHSEKSSCPYTKSDAAKEHKGCCTM